MEFKNRTDEGVSELQRLENCPGGGEKLRMGVRDWLSMSATLSLEVAGEEPDYQH
jgi:hypothetical protein